MKTLLTVGLAIGLGTASIGFAFDQNSLNSKLHNRTYGKMEMKERTVEKITVAEEETAAPSKRATVAVTHERRVSSEDRDLGKADTSRQNSKWALTGY